MGFQHGYHHGHHYGHHGHHGHHGQGSKNSRSNRSGSGSETLSTSENGTSESIMLVPKTKTLKHVVNLKKINQKIPTLKFP